MLSTLLATVFVALAPGLTSMDTVLGKGLEAKAGDLVTMTYKGWLQSTGSVFDETKGKPPFTFVLGAGEVIKGWDEGIPGMRKGGRRMLLLEPAMGYGDRDLGGIPPKSTLVFDVELLRIDPKGVKQMIEIEEIKAGEGPTAKLGDTVDVHYVGSFLNGEKFDSSRDRGNTFRVEIGKTGIIKGFEQGLIGMKQGDVRKVTIPYELAYGEAGRPPGIPARSTLVFELEVVKLETK